MIVAANNQNGNACDTTPARLSDGNPDVTKRKGVITAGGSMIVNRSWSVGSLSDVPGGVEADGGDPENGVARKGTQLPYVATTPVQEARWICGRGDSAGCNNATDTSTPNPALASYLAFTGGSNGGPCVTLFAPAKNLFLASNTAASGYRDGRLQASLASGTSFSAPIAAGVAARILQNEPTLSPAVVKDRLLANSIETQATAMLNPRDHNGNVITDTPNKFLRLSDVQIPSAGQPASTPAATSGTTQLTVAATGNATLSYQWFEVNDGFDYATNKNGAQSSALIGGATSPTFQAPASSTRKAYWVRATNDYGSADSNFAVVVPRPTGPPTSVLAEWNGSTVNVTWGAGTGAEKYQIERKVAGQPWTRVGLVGSSTFSFPDAPAPGGMAVYRVLSAAGEPYLPPENLATSSPSNNDIANLASHTYEPLPDPPARLTIRAQHLIDLRQAVNNLCDAVGAPRQFTDPELALSSLRFTPVDDDHFADLMLRINAIRNNSLIGMSQASFDQMPAQGVVISFAHLKSLRDALK